MGCEALVEHGMIAPADLELFSYAEDAEGGGARLLAGGLRPGQDIEGAPEGGGVR